ncbi:membrane lipoprotein lipid attachment site-containing protein [Desulfovibrio gilichinskyi]|uniref:DUF4136 domain-containing protein n=1 Tax=Desulfovibrio gilichinskyi TaxID=1519643 RepID=A0A1X7DSW7_9BACT|nr:membrane lipoprotein lipid attachment site-containing protein [Desulfovibrio gilichinskyi]SMF21159.1 hypothetical protein SAMN06295933_2320 [Desulfovibrio gilichinskyi]
MKKTIFLLIMIAALTACGAKTPHENSHYQDIDPAAKFRINPTIDESGFRYVKGTDSADLFKSLNFLDISSNTSVALMEELKKNNLFDETGSSPYSITVTVKEYKPGNAFGRWVFPGFAPTELSTQSVILLSDKPVQVINSYDSVYIWDSFGSDTDEFWDSFTVNAWEYIFQNVAQKEVKELRNVMGILDNSN